MSSNAATALIICALCAAIASCNIADGMKHKGFPKDAMATCLGGCFTQSCMKLCGEIVNPCGAKPQ